jgi:hydrogenase maturation protease
MEQKILVLGLGNTLLSDEGLGVAAVQRLTEAHRLEPEVEVLDGGTMGLDLLYRLEGVSHLIVVDAVKTGGAPGDLVRLEGDEIPKALATKMSMHQLGLQELLAVSELRGTLPPQVVLWGMEPASLNWGNELTPMVAGRLGDLVQAVAHELKAHAQPL